MIDNNRSLTKTPAHCLIFNATFSDCKIKWSMWIHRNTFNWKVNRIMQSLLYIAVITVVFLTSTLTTLTYPLSSYTYGFYSKMLWEKPDVTVSENLENKTNETLKTCVSIKFLCFSLFPFWISRVWQLSRRDGYNVSLTVTTDFLLATFILYT